MCLQQILPLYTVPLLDEIRGLGISKTGELQTKVSEYRADVTGYAAFRVYVSLCVRYVKQNKTPQLGPYVPTV
jgi:hypothetical protein